MLKQSRATPKTTITLKPQTTFSTTTDSKGHVLGAEFSRLVSRRSLKLAQIAAPKFGIVSPWRGGKCYTEMGSFWPVDSGKRLRLKTSQMYRIP